MTDDKTRAATGLAAVAGAAAMILSALSAQAQPAADTGLSTVRRTTIATADPEASLRFYRDLLGFSVQYDVTVTEPAQLAAFAPGASKGRAIALRRGETMGGSIGLFHTAGMKPAGACDVTAVGGGVAVMLLTSDLGALYRRLKDARVPFVNTPHTYDAGAGHGPTGTFTVFDPNCVRVAFAQIERETLQQSERR